MTFDNSRRLFPRCVCASPRVPSVCGGLLVITRADPQGAMKFPFQTALCSFIYIFFPTITTSVHLHRPPLKRRVSDSSASASTERCLCFSLIDVLKAFIWMLSCFVHHTNLSVLNCFVGALGFHKKKRNTESWEKGKEWNKTLLPLLEEITFSCVKIRTFNTVLFKRLQNLQNQKLQNHWTLLLSGCCFH